ncbi:penicillin acylase family protein [Granulicella paludicola]|uniref:penicillin acylase family protein n=1 Tax=Granulicella paludicola TaxID=474951 RepID=UPI0021DF45BD|nr:penicillin acylase family protein [Granulicella paludicola]
MSTATPTTSTTSRLRTHTAKRLVLATEILLLLLVLAALVTTIYLRHTLHTNLAQLDGEVHIAGLSAPVTITRDPHGVPSIDANSLDDLLFAQGYLTATDRLWQMDALRRHGAGELAEILGPSMVDHDRQQRYLQLRNAAERAVNALPADQLHQLNAYARGINAYIDTHANSLPVEFHVLHYTPAPWTPRDTLLIALVMSQDLSTSFPTKLNREALAAHLPANLIADMYPVGSWRDHPPMQPPVDLTAPVDVPQIPLDNSQSSLRPTATPHDLLTTNTALSRETCEGCRAGSNNWVVAGNRSATGAPLLSDDMHLSLTAPGIWYEAALHINDHSLDVEGFTLPGVPFVIVGRNQHVAWGLTNTGSDVQDLYIEHLQGSGSDTQFQQLDGSWAPVTHHPENIHVRGGRDLTLDVLTTTHSIGTSTIQTPVISPLYKSERRALALAWNIYDPTAITSPFLAINSAQDAASLVNAFSTFGGPSQNLVYADAQHIGYHTLGRIPIRGALDHRQRALPSLIAAPVSPDTDEDPTQLTVKPSPEQTPAAPVIDYTIGSPLANTPVDALDPTHQWAGYIPYNELPSIIDPPFGVLATANARITPDNYPYTITNNWVDPYRVERIRHLLDNRTNLTPADMLHVQTDVHSDVDLVIAQRLAYALDHASPSALHADKRLHDAANLLRAWHGDLTTDSAAATITVATRTELWPMLLSAQLRAHGVTDDKQNADLTALYLWGEKGTALERLIAHQPKRWLPANFPNWNDLLTGAVARALKQAPGNLATWKYGVYHPVEIAHPVFGSESFLSRLIGARTGTGLQPLGGDNTTVHAAGLHFGPSERFTADLANPDHTFANITTGESGNPASPFYLDQFPLWQAGTTLLMPLNQPTTSHTLKLLPQ